jgi:hypothetical protein
MTVEEREEAYKQARERIFANEKPVNEVGGPLQST